MMGFEAVSCSVVVSVVRIRLLVSQFEAFPALLRFLDSKCSDDEHASLLLWLWLLSVDVVSEAERL
jgi:hypothetical protein